ncbi:MAG: regulatory protein RecX [Actinomycetota bacterium]
MAADDDADPESAARAIVLRKLSAAPRTRAQLDEAMRRKGIAADVRGRVLERFSDVGLIDDAMFARMWVESRHAGRGLARKALAHELRRRGVDESLVDEAVDRLPAAEEEATARELVAKRLPATRGLEARTRTRRLAGMLARKGYPAALAARVVREALEGEGLDDVDLMEAEDW